MIRRNSKLCWGISRSEGSGNRKTSLVLPVSWPRKNPTTSLVQRSLSMAVCCGTTRSNSQSGSEWNTEKEVAMASKIGNPAQRVRVVIADVDGTLVTQEKVLTKRAAEAVLRLHEAGIQFSVTSGRPPRGMAMLIDPLKLNQPLAAFNGGVLIQPDLTTVVSQNFLPAGVAGSGV